MGIQASDLPARYRDQVEAKLRLENKNFSPPICSITHKEPRLPKVIIKSRTDRAEHPNKRRVDREGDEQCELVTHFESFFPAFASLLIHIPNGGFRKNAFEGWRLKSQGVKAGVSDLYLPVARGGYFGLWIEFKAARPFNAVISESQHEWIKKMLEQGYCAEVCMGAPAAMAMITQYLKQPATQIVLTSN